MQTLDEPEKNCSVIQQKPTNCGTEAADAPDKFFSRPECEPLNIMAHLQLLCAQLGKELGFVLLLGGTYMQTIESSLMTSQPLSFQNVAPSAIIWP